jgi:hypothetical protein
LWFNRSTSAKRPTVDLKATPAEDSRVFVSGLRGGGRASRPLVANMERDLGTKLDWIAVDH